MRAASVPIRQQRLRLPVPPRSRRSRHRALARAADVSRRARGGGPADRRAADPRRDSEARRRDAPLGRRRVQQLSRSRWPPESPTPAAVARHAGLERLAGSSRIVIAVSALEAALALAWADERPLPRIDRRARGFGGRGILARRAPEGGAFHCATAAARRESRRALRRGSDSAAHGRLPSR